MESHQKITVYYDGLCKVCSKEIQHYMSQKGAETIRFIDICSGHFNAESEGLDPKLVHKIMHVRRNDGSLATRVDAFIEIWKVLPRYNFLATYASKKPVKLLLESGYSTFALIRPFLPRSKKADLCAESPYCDLNSGEIK